MDADDFEYHITFPSCQDLCFVNDKDPNECTIDEPVIFLLGCKGFQDDTLSKYSCVYEEGGLTCIRYNPVISPMFSIRPPMQLWYHAQKLVALLYDYSLDKQPLFFHVIGRDGSLVYDLMSKELQKPENDHIKVKGCIFQSAPVNMSLGFVLSMILSDTVHSPENWITKFATGIWKLSYVWLASCCCSVLNLFYNCDAFTTGIWQRLALENRHCPQLFINKGTDRNTSIKAFIKKREKLGVKTAALTEQEFKDKDSYGAHVLAFVEHCLET